MVGGEKLLNGKILTQTEENELYKVATEFQEKGYVTIKCPKCGGVLDYVGNYSSYKITCTNKCGIILACRGI